MYAIKARFDGAAIIPTEEIPVSGPYEMIVTFTKPMEQSRPKESILDFAGIFDSEDVAIIEEIIRERREPSTGPDFAVP
ncbi:MAG: hypothetical protein LBJ86_02265 [Spirochaetaceae bacterium]|jgi:hypothetical protein|nr:hypothetical protein [Spirochaetaceae bacterium]